MGFVVGDWVVRKKAFTNIPLWPRGDGPHRVVGVSPNGDYITLDGDDRAYQWADVWFTRVTPIAPMFQIGDQVRRKKRISSGVGIRRRGNDG